MKVPFELAFSWDCPFCHVRNYLDPVAVELSADEKAELVEYHNLQPDHVGRHGAFMCPPDYACCLGCQREVEIDQEPPPGSAAL